MLVRLDELADVLVSLELGPCASPTVRRLERVEVTAGNFARMLRGCRGRGQPERDTGGEEDGKEDPARVYGCAAGSEHGGAWKLLSCLLVVAWALG